MKENKKILIVDDEPKNLKILRIRLDKDYELKEAASGEEALALVESFQPALVLLDIMMGGMDGYEVTQKLKNNPKTKLSKVVLVSGKAMIEEKLEGYHCGADDYITKPFNGEELKAKVDVYVRLYNLETQLASINESLEQEIELRSAQLLKSERLAFVGMHSAEIVHNLKTPLAIIKGYIGQLRNSHPGLLEIEKIDAAVGKILEIVKNILSSVDRDMKSEMMNLSLEESIREELEFLRLDSEYKDKVKTELLFKDNVRIHASKAHLGQIFGNLIKNAAEAMRNSAEKKLTITTEDFEGFTLIRVIDTGEGIAPENLSKVFEPLFTTKDGKGGSASGNGLGLSYCRKMIETYGGRIHISSKSGQGTEVTVKFPHRKTSSALKPS